MRRTDLPIAGWPDRAIAQLAARQQTIVTRVQLLDLGASAEAIKRALRRGRLHRVHQGVYSLVPARARPRHAEAWAAILACGATAALSHQTAAVAHGLRLPVDPRTVQVTVTDSDRSRPGITIHTTHLWLPGERYLLDGLPTTSLPRTMLDIAPRYRATQLAPLVDQALRRTSRTKLRDAIADHPHRPGAPLLTKLLDPARPSADAWSKREAHLRALIARAGLPTPESNIALGRYVADLIWRDQRVIVEYDDAFYHGQPGVFHAGHGRHNDLSAIAGYHVVHVTDVHLDHEPEKVIVWIALALHHGGGW